MNYKISFQERAQLDMEMLSKKPPVTLEQARTPVKRISQVNQLKVKK